MAVRPVAGIGFSVLLVGACVGILTAPMYGLIQLRKMDQDQRVWTAEIEQRQAERARLAGLIDEQLKALRQAEVSLAGTKAELDALTTERNRIQAEIAGDSEQLSARERRLADVELQVQEAEGQVAVARAQEQSLIAANKVLEVTNQRMGVDNADRQRLRNEATELAKTVEIEKASAARLAADQTVAKEQLAETKAELATAKLELANGQSTFKTYKEKANVDAGELRSSIERLTLEKSDIAKTVGAFDARRMELATELETKVNELATIQKQIAEAKRTLQETNDKSQAPARATEALPPQPASDAEGTSNP